MSRLLTVVNERKRLRSQYRMHLEDEYIKEQKDKEREQFLAERKRLEELGVTPLPQTNREIGYMLKKKDEKKAEELSKARVDIKQSIEESEQSGTIAPLMNEEDIDFLAQTKVKLNQKDILKMYVGNWAELDLKQRRRVMFHIQKQRSKHAKQIFLKELSAIGRKLDRQTKFDNSDALITNARVKGKKDPLKLKLEALT